MTATLPIALACCGGWVRAASAPFRRFLKLRQGTRVRVALALSTRGPRGNPKSS